MNVKKFTKNKIGKDYIVGDIHGCFSKLSSHLDSIGFNRGIDRLFSVGDLVDRGPECELVLQWLDFPWFHPVKGNHDDYVCRYDTCDIGNWLINGGIWFQALTQYEQKHFQDYFMTLPIAIELETSQGNIGILHADCVFSDWNDLINELNNPQSNKRFKEVSNSCMWSRKRYENRMFEQSNVSGIRAVICGHTPIEKPEWVGNVFHIDTAGWHPNGYGFTVIDAETLQPVKRLLTKGNI